MSGPTATPLGIARLAHGLPASAPSAVRWIALTSIDAMESGDAVGTRVRRAIEEALSASAIEVAFTEVVGPAMGLAAMPSLKCSARDVVSEVEIYFEDPLLAYVEVYTEAWHAHQDMRADWLETSAGARWLADLITQRWTVTRRFGRMGARVLKANSPGPHLVVLNSP